MNGVKQVHEQKKILLTPLILTVVIIVIDQIVKALIVSRIELYHVGFSMLDSFLRIVHTRNLGIAFSMGTGFPDVLRSILFIVIPLAILSLLIVYYLKSKELTSVQRWAIAAILGGGFGNLIDRIFRPEGVVDFIDIKFFGILGMDRWPTFNIADASVVVAGIILIGSIIFQKESKLDHE
jgi:signal peptidase II